MPVEKPSLEVVIGEVKRELACRTVAYPNWIKNKRLSKVKADFQMRAMERCLEILTNISALVPGLNKRVGTLLAALNNVRDNKDNPDYVQAVVDDVLGPKKS